MEIFANLSPFAGEIADGSIITGEDLMKRVDNAGFGGLEMNLRYLDHPEGNHLLEGLDFRRVSFHSNFLESRIQ